jgi:hypothetical protein
MLPQGICAVVAGWTQSASVRAAPSVERNREQRLYVLLASRTSFISSLVVNQVPGVSE